MLVLMQRGSPGTNTDGGAGSACYLLKIDPKHLPGGNDG